MMLTVLIVLCYDVWFYLSHIMLHTKYMWPYHQQHHRSKASELTYKEAYNSSFIEMIFQSLGVLVPLFFMTLSFGQCLLALLFLNVRGMLRHEPRAAWLIGDHHLIHHHNPSVNYGEYWLDKLCGTEEAGYSMQKYRSRMSVPSPQ
jgi:sterol desaturase/sphingolipid hydroxylase (fatty acid hydroxylase superfamily)